MLAAITRTLLVAMIVECIRCKNFCIENSVRFRENSYIVPHNNSLTFQPSGLLQCAKQCVMFPKCVFWDYNRKTLKCTIHLGSNKASTPFPVPQKGYITSHKLLWRQDFPGNCSNCKSSDTCLPFVCQKVCPSSYQRFDSNSCWKFTHANYVTNAKAQEACKSDGGNLFTVDTGTKNRKLRSYVKNGIQPKYNYFLSLSLLKVWIDGHINNNGNWTTYDGKEFTPILDTFHANASASGHCIGYSFDPNTNPYVDILDCSSTGLYVCQYQL